MLNSIQYRTLSYLVPLNRLLDRDGVSDGRGRARDAGDADVERRRHGGIDSLVDGRGQL